MSVAVNVEVSVAFIMESDSLLRGSANVLQHICGTWVVNNGFTMR